MDNQRVNQFYPSAGALENGKSRVPLIDSISGGSQVILTHHHEIHDGNHFFVSNYSALDTSDTTKITFTTPASSKRCHMLWTLLSTGPMTVAFYEGASGISGGSEITPVNNNRDSSNVSASSLLLNPTVSSAGSLLSQVRFGTAGSFFSSATGGADNRESELLLATNTPYYLLVTSLADGVIFNYHLKWDEYVPRN